MAGTRQMNASGLLGLAGGVCLIVCLTASFATARADDPAPPPACEIGLKPAFTSFNDCLRAARAHDAAAMLELAWRYERGRGVRKDAAEALQWLRHAAAEGNALARFALACRLMHGVGVTADAKQAIVHYTAAGEQGYAPAQYALGIAFLAGTGVAKDEAEAHAHLARSAAGGHAPAQFEVGYDFEKGRGATKDEPAAVAWYEKAARQKNLDARYRLAQMYKSGRGVEEPDAEAALQHLRKAANDGHVPSMWAAAEMLRTGDGVKRNEAQAIRWFEKLAKRRHREGQVEMAGLDARRYRRITRALRLKDGKPECEPGSPVATGGFLRTADPESWHLDLPERHSFRVLASDVRGGVVRDGRYIDVWGFVEDDGTFRALLYEVPAPSVVWSAPNVRSKTPLGTHRSVEIVVGFSVTNNGKQPIHALTLEVRTRGTYRGYEQSVTLDGLAPGERRFVSVDFDVYIGDIARMPRAEVRGPEIEW